MALEEEIASVAINVTAPHSAAWSALQGSEHHREYVRRLSLAIAPLLNRVRAEALREAAGDLFASAKGSAALQRAHDIAEGVAPIGTSTPNEAEWYQMGNWARSTLLAFADRIEQNSEGNET